MAHRLGLTGLYEIMVEAGVRAEMLLGRLGGYEELSGGEEESMELDDDDDETPELAGTPQTEVTQPELEQKEVNSKDYLASELTYHPDKLLDADNNGVMMEWERGIMERSIEALLGKAQGKNVLNVGFGMGIIDTLFHETKPALHVIVEPHKDVLKRMKEDGWDKKDGVEILGGRWQDVIPLSHPLLATCSNGYRCFLPSETAISPSMQFTSTPSRRTILSCGSSSRNT